MITNFFDNLGAWVMLITINILMHLLHYTLKINDWIKMKISDFDIFWHIGNNGSLLKTLKIIKTKEIKNIITAKLWHNAKISLKTHIDTKNHIDKLNKQLDPVRSAIDSGNINEINKFG